MAIKLHGGLMVPIATRREAQRRNACHDPVRDPVRRAA